MSLIKRMIEVPFMKEGIHRYPAALIDPKLIDVKYLGLDHFHYFYFTVKIEVFHDDRDLEFQQFRRWLESLYNDSILSLDHKSCEMMAEELINIITQKYPGRDMVVRVFEDNINGTELTFTK